ncbi:MAG TPA: LemA family protein [Candidatus Brocadiaceae bacterium]
MPPTGLIIIFVVIILLPIIWLIATYNNLVKLRFQCRNAWSNIDTELKRRYELIPNLVETVKGYAQHERQVLQSVTDARAKAVASTGSPASQAKDENALIGSLRQLFGVVENYPDLKASQNFLKLQSQLVETEDRIQAARRFYNGNVRDLNTLVQSFPSNIIASLFAFSNEEFFDIEEVSMRAAPQVRI